MGRSFPARISGNYITVPQKIPVQAGLTLHALTPEKARQQARDQLTDAMAEYRIKRVFYLQVTGR
jgi:hypothetical protein